MLLCKPMNKLDKKMHQMANKEETVKECSQIDSDIFKKLADLEESLAKKDEELYLMRKEKDLLSEKVKVYHLKIQDVEKDSRDQFKLLSSRLNFEPSTTEKHKEQEELSRLRIDYEKLKDNYEKLNENHERLKEKYERVTELLEEASTDEKEKLLQIENLLALNSCREKVYLEKVDNLTAKLIDVKQQLNESNVKATEMEDKFSLVAEESENIEILKAQIAVYKKDFVKTEAVCKAAQDEVQRLTKELEKHQ